MSRTTSGRRGVIEGMAALTLALSALAACGRQAPEETATTQSMPGADATQESSAAAPNAVGAPLPATTTPSATGTDASGAVNPTDDPMPAGGTTPGGGMSTGATKPGGAASTAAPPNRPGGA